MMENNEYASVLLKKVFLSVFLFALVILAGRIIYAGFSGFAACFAKFESGAEAGLVPVNPQELLNGGAAYEKTQTRRNSDGDIALRLYRSEKTRDAVIGFYSELTGDSEISAIILKYADENNISPSLAFALSWEESRFQPRAVNVNSNSVDRGLFQLNSRSFPELSEREMFNPDINAKNGLSHLRFCIDHSGNEVAALAMYNAGAATVLGGKTPKSTLDYVSRILSYREATDIDLFQLVADSIM